MCDQQDYRSSPASAPNLVDAHASAACSRVDVGGACEDEAVRPLDDLLPRIHVVTLPLVTRFRRVSEREAMLIEGTERWSEWSPFLEYEDAEAAQWLHAALEYAFDPELELAPSGFIPVNATVPAVAADAVPGVLDRFGTVRAVKVKVAEPGQSLEDDLARVAAVRAVLGDEALVRVDANGGWGVDEAVHALERLSSFNLDYAEQPVAAVEDLARLRERLQGRVRIAADESIRKASDPLRVARLGAADRIIVKVQPLGGIRRASEIVRQVGLPATVSSALESSVGLTMGAQLAARIARESQAEVAPAGLGTAALFGSDVTGHPKRPADRMISLAPVVPDPDLLARHAASPERRAWWIARLTRCLEHLD